MRLTLLANLSAYALFSGLAAHSGILRWEVLLFQLLLQALTNEFWIDIFALAFKGKPLLGAEGNKLADMARVHRMARLTSPFLLLFPGLLLGGMMVINVWGEGALGNSLHLPLGLELLVPCMVAQGLLFVASLAGGLLPLSYRTLIEARMARRERQFLEEDGALAGAATAPEPPARAGVEALPHSLPEGVVLPPCLSEPQRCSALHVLHTELVRSRLREGEAAILSTAPAGVVPLPSSSNERSYGAFGLCVAAALLYPATGLLENVGSVTLWAALLLGLGLGVASVRLLRSSARRQSKLLRTDYFLTNRRLHVCRAGRWESVALVSMEVVPGSMYTEDSGDVELCPESGPKTYTMVNVEHPAELCSLLERLIYTENAR